MRRGVRRWLAALLWIPLALACGGAPQALHPDTPAVVAACTHLRALGCEAGQDTDGGAKCEDVIAISNNEGVATYDLTCLASIKDCSEEPGCARW